MSSKILLKEIMYQIEAGADGTVMVWDSTKQFGFRMQAVFGSGGTIDAANIGDGSVTNAMLAFLAGVTSALPGQIIRPGGTATGTDTYVLTPTPALSAYAANLYYNVLFTDANTGAATLNVSGLGAKAIQYKGSALSAARIPALSRGVVWYDGTQFQLLGYWG